jgi:hypothetical protein
MLKRRRRLIIFAEFHAGGYLLYPPAYMEAIKQRAPEIFNNKPRLVAWWDRVKQREAVCKANKKYIVWQEAWRQKARTEVKASKNPME